MFYSLIWWKWDWIGFYELIFFYICISRFIFSFVLLFIYESIWYIILTILTDKGSLKATKVRQSQLGACLAYPILSQFSQIEVEEILEKLSSLLLILSKRVIGWRVRDNSEAYKKIDLRISSCHHHDHHALSFYSYCQVKRNEVDDKTSERTEHLDLYTTIII